MNTKRTILSIIFFLTSFIYFLLAYKGFKKQNIDLSSCDKVESIVIDKGIDYRYGNKGKKSICFYILLQGTNNKLGVYRKGKNYEDLLSKFHNGDSITAYYIGNNNNFENINIDLVQVERKGEILLDKKEYEKKESSLIYIGMIAGILTVILSYLYYKGIIFKNHS